MKLKDYAIVAFLHFLCTFVLGLVVSHFITGTNPMQYFWVAVGVGVGRFFVELVKYKFKLKTK